MYYWLNRFVIFDFIDQLETLSEETQFWEISITGLQVGWKLFLFQSGKVTSGGSLTRKMTRIGFFRGILAGTNESCGH